MRCTASTAASMCISLIKGTFEAPHALMSLKLRNEINHAQRHLFAKVFLDIMARVNNLMF